MPTAEEKRLFCEAMGIRVDQIKVERVAHPTRRTHLIFRVSHPELGAGEHALEHEAWQRFFDEAEKRPPLPMRCEAKTKDGRPCQNAPQSGRRFCGPHLAQAAAAPEATALCQGRTARGEPCKNAPQKGELYCGPHLAKARR